MTIKTSSGTTSYAVTSSSDLEKSGKTTTLGALAVGDNVAFSTTTTDGTAAIDTLIVRNAPTGMAGGCQTPPNGASGAGTNSSAATSSPESPA